MPTPQKNVLKVQCCIKFSCLNKLRLSRVYWNWFPLLTNIYYHLSFELVHAIVGMKRYISVGFFFSHWKSFTEKNYMKKFLVWQQERLYFPASLSIFSCAYWSFLYLFWRKVFSNPFLIIKMGSFIFYLW